PNWIRKGALIMMTLIITGCATNFVAPKFISHDNPYFESGDLNNRGYKQEEATQFIEFCVDLDNQDDRYKSEQDNQLPDPALGAKIDKRLWDPTPIYDSRLKVAEDVYRYIHTPNNRTAYDEHWSKLYEEIARKANQVSPQWNTQSVAKNPNLNGFGPWQNAWTLYKGRGSNENAYAIAIRGTVLSNRPSVVEDAILNPVEAQGFLDPNLNFAGVSDASLHGGFAHATLTLMLDNRYGVLHVLRDEGKVPDGAKIFIIGHSQGASMATMAHAFMHYALRHDMKIDPVNPVFKLQNAGYRLKSYGFAQPKPGNYTFASDFARITQRSENAIIINNAIDPVPKIPPTLQTLADLDSDVTGPTLGAKVYRGIAGIGAWIRHLFATEGEKKVRNSAEGYGYFYNYPTIKIEGKNERTGSSWDFVPAGRVIMVYGSIPTDPKKQQDMFYQHHATTYRELIHLQLPP
ncbi:MAG: hypothetical protein KGK17_00935, partial [Betaproteobacteria bacterium]|nr:hypothetical protein [Betaproteobacteria bacterium]